MRTGDHVQDFVARDADGKEVRLSELLAGGPVVLFFYPRAMTAGCTKEACHFRDLAREFAEVGASRVGISADSSERQAEFAGKHELDFPLLSDPGRTIAKQFGVKRPGPLANRRATFVIDTDFAVLDAISSEVDMDVHADRALRALRERVV